MASQSPYLTLEGPAGVRIEVNSFLLGEAALRLFFSKEKIEESSLGDVHIGEGTTIDNVQEMSQVPASDENTIVEGDSVFGPSGDVQGEGVTDWYYGEEFMEAGTQTVQSSFQMDCEIDKAAQGMAMELMETRATAWKWKKERDYYHSFYHMQVSEDETVKGDTKGSLGYGVEAIVSTDFEKAHGAESKNHNVVTGTPGALFKAGGGLERAPGKLAQASGVESSFPDSEVSPIPITAFAKASVDFEGQKGEEQSKLEAPECTGCDVSVDQAMFEDTDEDWPDGWRAQDYLTYALTVESKLAQLGIQANGQTFVGGLDTSSDYWKHLLNQYEAAVRRAAQSRA